MFKKFTSLFSSAPVTPEQIISGLKLLPSACCLTDEKGTVLYASPRMQDVLGYPAAEMQGMPVDSFGLGAARLEQQLAGADSAHWIEELVTQDMRSIPVSVGAARVAGTAYTVLSLEALPDYGQTLGEKNLFQSVVACYPFAVAVQDRKGLCLAWNQRAAQLFGPSAQQVVGRPMREGVPQELAGALEILDREVWTKKTSCLERQMTCKDARGKDLVLSVSKVPLGTGESGFSALMTVFEDITTRHVQETELLQKSNLLQAILDHIPLGIYTRTIDGEMTYFNKQSQVILSEADPKYVNSPHPNQKQETVQGYATREHQLLAEGKRKEYPDEVYVDHDGHEKLIHMIKVPLTQAGPRPLVLSIVEDVTQKREQEREIKTTNRLLAAIVDNMPIGMYARTKTGQLLMDNKMSKQIFHDDGDLNEQGFSSHETQEEVHEYLSREGEILSQGKTVDIAEEAYTAANGKNLILHLVKVPVKDADDLPGFVITMVEDITQRKAQERQLEEVQAFQTAILENAPLGIYARGMDHKMSFINAKARSIFEDEPIISADGNTFYEQRELSLFESGETQDIAEEEWTGRDGQQHILHMIKVPVFDKAKKPFLVLTLVEDITQKKQQERELAEANQLSQIILDNVPVAIYAYSPDRNIRFFNRMAETLFPDEKESTRNIDKYTAREQAILEQKETVDISEEEYINKEGGHLLLHLIKVPVFDKDGKPFFVLTIAEDITQKKQQEREILNAKNFLQNVVDNLPVALSVKKADGVYIVWNKRSEELFGVKAAEVIGQSNYRRDITKEQAEFMQEADQKVFESRRELNIAQELISTPVEGVKIMHTVKTPLYTPQGEPDYLLSVSEDITAQTNMEKQIRRTGEQNTLLVENAREGIVILEDHRIIYANRSAGRLLGFASHDEAIGQKLADFVAPDHLPFAREKYEAVINGMQGSQEPLQVQFINHQGASAELEVALLASRYLGRRIVIAFLRDVTAATQDIRRLRSERETFRHVFELGPAPALILNSKGYISSMNKAARELFHFVEKDRNFYRNVYMRPALPLEVRRRMSRGESARMEYVFDFDQAAGKFPGRIHGTGRVNLQAVFIPFNLHKQTGDHAEVDYLVTLDVKRTSGGYQACVSSPALTEEETVAAPEAPASAAPAAAAAAADSAEETALGPAARGFTDMLKQVDLPAAVLDLACTVQYVNEAFQSATGRSKAASLKQDFFREFIRQGEEGRRQFVQAQEHASGNAFQVTLDLAGEYGQYVSARWDVFLLKDTQGQLEGYGLIAVRKQ